MALKVGILGAGQMGTLHAGILARDDRVQLRGVADLNEARGRELASKYEARYWADLEALLGSGIEILYITTPNTTHTQPTIEALSRGVHVFCEKPFATTVAEAEEIAATAARSAAVYQGGHNRRFAPAYRFLKEKIEAGFTPFLAHIKMNDGDLKDPPWLSDRSKTGGFLYETTIHLLDIAVWLMGAPLEVQALAANNLYPDLVDWAILMRFEKERFCTLSSSGHASWHSPTERVEIVGDHACLVSEGLDVATCSPGLGQPVESLSYYQLPKEHKWGYFQEDETFISAIINRSDSAFSVHDGLNIVKLVEACYRSAEIDRRVALA